MESKKGFNLQNQIRYYNLTKRMFDIIIALMGLTLTFPIILFTALLIKIETPGNAFFFQERVGLNGKYFKIIKLRSMGVDAEINGAKWAEKNDPRVTRIGAFIRKTRIDELPQLFNVLIGEMSLIGPRPERPLFTAKFNEEVPGFIKRLSVKPGLTGWAQVNGGYDLTINEKLDKDLFYIENCNLTLDIIIILKTINVCITGSGAR
ncbi:UDP-phosphate N-acetylgalactosaminyl-1-phosphate transferase [Rossellomorea vietnamensis]|uniref:UDP-phosphate N-acetylgalactosaminyl-1-phosphate transferase n=1 Tax=Rossellomorea vietnamensis TaxID=218284 RepID=A0A0P6W106_9BACI|nr:exopolysaccharide biosynthesis polyprenyl glycosylphosphotransferase [Rossellomorea vietnamensis]KPL59388.1 UDP-phosphate N-acetylgalactosaminyl-1-phosphate transferase [Rossellomorea vietnamensis]